MFQCHVSALRIIEKKKDRMVVFYVILRYCTVVLQQICLNSYRTVFKHEGSSACRFKLLLGENALTVLSNHPVVQTQSCCLAALLVFGSPTREKVCIFRSG